MRGKGARGKTRLGEGANRTFAALPQKAARCRQLRATAEIADFCRIFFFPLSQEGVPSHCRDMVMSKDETAIAQLEIKLSAPPLAGASRRDKHGTLHHTAAYPRGKRSITARRAQRAHCPAERGAGIAENSKRPREGAPQCRAAQDSPRRKRRQAPARALLT